MKKILFFNLIVFLFFLACGPNGESSDANTKAQVSAAKPKSMVPKKLDPMDNIGVGPIKSAISLGDLDEGLAQQGEEIFKAKCTACHKTTKKFIGPAPKGIFERRNPTWVMNMILDPEQMVKKDPIAKKLLMEYNGSPMANQNLSKEDARAIVEYFRTL